MKTNKGWKELFKELSPYNQRKLIEANRPFGKDPKAFKKMIAWILAILAALGLALIIGR